MRQQPQSSFGCVDTAGQRQRLFLVQRTLGFAKCLQLLIETRAQQNFENAWNANIDSNTSVHQYIYVTLSVVVLLVVCAAYICNNERSCMHVLHILFRTTEFEVHVHVITYLSLCLSSACNSDA